MNRARWVIVAAGLTIAIHGATAVQAAPGVTVQQTATARAIANLENDVAQGTVTYTPTSTPTPTLVPTRAPAPTETAIVPTIEPTPAPVSRWQPAYLWTDADGNLMVNLGSEQIPVVAYGDCDGVIPDTDVFAWRMDAGEAINTAYVMWDLMMISGQYNCVLQIHDYAPQAVAVESVPTDVPPAVAYVPVAQPQVKYVQSAPQIVYITPVPAEPTYTPIPTATTLPTAAATSTATPSATPSPSPTYTLTALPTTVSVATIVLPDETLLLAPPEPEPIVIAEPQPQPKPRPPPITGSGRSAPLAVVLAVAPPNEYPGEARANRDRRLKVQV